MGNQQTVRSNSSAIWYGIFAFSLWGVLPLYWKLLDTIPALEILAHRILWSFVFTSIFLLITRGWPVLKAALADRRKLAHLILCGFLVSLNWFVYIYAINSNHVIEASMGYYINPLVVVLLGMIVFKERLNFWQIIALILAGLGVLNITVQYGRVPWIALFLAASFSLYGLMKKIIKVDATTGLVLETFGVTPIALAYIISLEVHGMGALGTTTPVTAAILAGTGIITAIPLLLYARGVQTNQFSMMGFLQFITSTINLILGIYVFKEYFSTSHIISFCFIWVALIIFSLANMRVLKG